MENNSFSLENLSSLGSFKERREYCDNSLIVLAHGSGRIIYSIDKDHVLKLAYVPQGITQNELESSLDVQHFYSDIVTKVEQHDKRNKWLICEKAQSINEKQFFKFAEVQFKIWVAYLKGKRVDNESEYIITEHNHFLKRVLEMSGENGYADFQKLNSYGIVKRNGKEQIVLVDYAGV